MKPTIEIAHNSRAAVAMNALLEVNTTGDQLNRGLKVIDGTLGRRISVAEADAFVTLLTALEAQGRLNPADLPQFTERLTSEANVRNAFEKAMSRRTLKAGGVAVLLGLTIGLASYFSAPLGEAMGWLSQNAASATQIIGMVFGAMLGAVGIGVALHSSDRSQSAYGRPEWEPTLEPLVAEIEAQLPKSR
ncbi:MAG: hypothetical protein IT384_04130 [Deltaproteobacteria bacterium]|nr:hypothetical protein [Deltaproteobacteria bacterium]